MTQVKKKNWNLHTKRADFNALSLNLGVDKVIARIMVNRGIEPDLMPSFLRPSKNDFNDPNLLKDSEVAVDIIENAIKNREKIRIIGDYDIDGICATYILKSCIDELGGIVDYYLPKRIEDGYGMNDNIVKRASCDGIGVIITVDNGISAHQAINLAKELGITVVITDHHEIPKDESGDDKLPDADAVVDPKRADCVYPYKEICGAVVAWKVASILYLKNGYDEKKPLEYLEFAAFASVGDIMRLHDENRAIVSMGLKQMVHTRNLGLRTLIECCGLNGKQINAYHVGFVLGPCLNAGGRLSDASLGVELFETEDKERAIEIAEELRLLNEERKQMTLDGTEDAIAMIEKNGYQEDSVIVVYVPEVHESLCGIIAGRLRERYTRPCFMLTDGENYVKGSGRSIPDYPMFERMSEVEELFLMYGGHPMAAGLSIDRGKIDELRTRLNRNCHLTKDSFIESIMIDVPMPLGYITEDLIRQLELLEPFGNGNDKPVFARKNVCVFRHNRIGRNGEYLKLLLKDEGATMDALYFSDADEFLKNVDTGDHIDILYYPQINEYRGTINLQIVITDYRKTFNPED